RDRMSFLSAFFPAIEHSTIAITIRDSQIFTGLLSGLHLIGLTLLVGGVLVSSVGLAGMVVNDQPIAELTRASRRGSLVGMMISISTGLLLLSSRLSMATASRAFQIKMLTLLAALLFHFLIYRPAARGH